MSNSDDFRQMIKKYNDEIKKMQKKSKPIAENETSTVQSDNVSKEETPKNTQSQNEQTPFQFKNEYSLPNILQNQMIKGQTEGLTGEGYLIVRVFAANGAAPISGANVLVSFDEPGGERLVKSAATDVNGETKKLALPTVAIGESLEPGVKNPYASYSIRVSSDGYFTIDSINVPIFDKQTAIQPVEMIPLPENYKGPTVLNSNDTGSITLN
ncbi:MAG: carboxypeptidase-like regulatory domain-containing protein [Acutalibacteraceae bacterium]|nr:carboxypeptidase-like regulatory domain-containing protein [Acutalibacteraceae bacterium]